MAPDTWWVMIKYLLKDGYKSKEIGPRQNRDVPLLLPFKNNLKRDTRLKGEEEGDRNYDGKTREIRSNEVIL